MSLHKNTIVLGAALATMMLVGTQAANAEKILLDSEVSVGVDVKITVDLLKSDMFETLVAINVPAPRRAAPASSIVNLDSMTTADHSRGSIMSRKHSRSHGRISHDFVPLPPEFYQTRARIGPARYIEAEDLRVRVVYANPIPLRDTIKFHRTKN